MIRITSCKGSLCRFMGSYILPWTCGRLQPKGVSRPFEARRTRRCVGKPRPAEKKLGNLFGKQDFGLPARGESCRLGRRRSAWFPDLGEWPRAFLSAQGDCHQSRAELPLKPDSLISRALGRSISHRPVAMPQTEAAAGPSECPIPVKRGDGGRPPFVPSPWASAVTNVGRKPRNRRSGARHPPATGPGRSRRRCLRGGQREQVGPPLVALEVEQDRPFTTLQRIVAGLGIGALDERDLGTKLGQEDARERTRADPPRFRRL